MEVLFAAGQVVLVVIAAPFLQGVIKKIKALSQGRRGFGLLQPYRDLRRLFAKDMVISRSASMIFHVTPYIVFASTVTAALFIPVVVTRGGALGLGDIVAIVYVLTLGKFFTALAGLDTGTAFGGEGSSREMTVSLLVEPMMMLAVFTAAVAGGSTDVSLISVPKNFFFSPANVLAFAAFYIAVIAETGRIPVDNPDTHLELTMVHEGMILEYSGRYLALIEWSHWIKQVLLLTLAADLFFPYGIAAEADGVLFASAAWIIKMLVLGTALALTESSRVKLRFFKLPALLGGAFVLSLLSLMTFIVMGK